jgi:hypothetical protein
MVELRWRRSPRGSPSGNVQLFRLAEAIRELLQSSWLTSESSLASASTAARSAALVLSPPSHEYRAWRQVSDEPAARVSARSLLTARGQDSCCWG